LRVL
jgi:hypothetical protein